MARSFALPTIMGVAAVVEQGGRIVLVRQSYKKGWYLPGGGVGRFEPPADAVVRELKEEIGLTHCATPQLLGLYVRKTLFMTNFIAVYRVREAVFVFRPGWEVRELILADPAAPPAGTTRAVRRRLLELQGEKLPDPFW